MKLFHFPSGRSQAESVFPKSDDINVVTCTPVGGGNASSNPTHTHSPSLIIPHWPCVTGFDTNNEQTAGIPISTCMIYYSFPLISSPSLVSFSYLFFYFPMKHPNSMCGLFCTPQKLFTNCALTCGGFALQTFENAHLFDGKLR